MRSLAELPHQTCSVLRPVSRRCRPGGAGRAGRGPRPGGGVHVPARVCHDQPRGARPGPGHLAVDQGGAAYGGLVIAIDGKAVRSVRNQDGKAPHLVVALAHGIGTVLGVVAVAARPNEIPAARDLLRTYASLVGTVITIDGPI